VAHTPSLSGERGFFMSTENLDLSVISPEISQAISRMMM
jgi:hypothetical protein